MANNILYQLAKLANFKNNFKHTKCQHIFFGTHQRLSKFQTENYKVQIGGGDVSQVRETKLLGIVFDSRLTFEAHINKLCKKISQKLGLLKYLKTLLPHYYTNMLFNALVKPHFDYCDIIWGKL